jgi:hypothetical protein
MSQPEQEMRQIVGSPRFALDLEFVDVLPKG